MKNGTLEFVEDSRIELTEGDPVVVIGHGMSLLLLHQQDILTIQIDLVQVYIHYIYK